MSATEPLRHLRASTANKRPTPAAMADGQLALNTNNTSPGLFFKDSNGALVKVGPVHVGTTAPNASPAAGGSTGNAIGEQWLDTAGGTYVFKVWDGSAWRSETGTFVDVNGDVMTGALGIIAGSASAPGLYFSGDTNTGIYSPGADQVAISTNSVGRLFVDSSGRVGVNNSSPGGQLSVERSDGHAVAIFNQSSGSWNNDVQLNHSSAAGAFLLSRRASGDAWFYQTGAYNIAFHTNSAERLRITSDGKVGLGTSSPGKTLDVNGESRFTVAATINNGAAWYTAGDPGGYLYLGNAIGTPASVESYAPSPRSSAAELALRFKTVSTGGSALTALTIDSSQRVGVGTTSPVATFQVAGSSGAGIRVDQGNYNYYGAFEHVWMNSGFTTERARIDSSGRFGIGTSSPSDTLHVVGTSQITGSARFNNSIQLRAATQNYIYFDDALSLTRNGVGDRLTIDSSGRVGIGTNSPQGLFSLTSAGTSTQLTVQTVAGAFDTVKFDTHNSSAVRAIYAWYQQNNEVMRLDQQGRFLMGTSSSITTLSDTPKSQVFVGDQGAASFIRGSANEFGPNIHLAKSRNTAPGSRTILQSGDEFGSIFFAGDDGSTLNSIGARIFAQVDGTPGTNNMPGRLIFSTTVNGAASPTERMRINSSGFMGLWTTTPQSILDVGAGATSAPTYKGTIRIGAPGAQTINTDGGLEFLATSFSNGYGYRIATFDLTGGNVPLIIQSRTDSSAWTERVRLDAQGRLGIGTTTPVGRLSTENGIIFVGNTDGTSDSRIQFQQNNGAFSWIGQPTWNKTTLFVYGPTASSAEVAASYGSSTWTFSTGGTERARIDSSGRFGIGTSSAQQALHVSQSGGNGFAGIRSQNSNTGTGIAGIEFSSDSTYAKAAIGLVRGDANGVGSLVLYNASSTGAANWSTSDARMVIDSQGRVGVGTSTPTSKLQAEGEILAGYSGTTKYVSLFPGNATDSPAIGFPTGPLRFIAGGSEYGRWDGSGRLLVGTSISTAVSEGEEPFLQVKGTDSRGGLSLARFSNDAQACGLYIGKSRGTSIGSNTIVASGDELGRITFSGSDGTDLNTQAANIKAEVDGTPGANSMPGRIVLSTTASGASSPTERMRIANDGLTTLVSANHGYASRCTGAAGIGTFLFYGYHSATAGNPLSGTLSFVVYSNGNVQNTNGSYTALSDAKLKENIVDASSQWDDLKAIQIRNWNFKAETGHETHRQIGPIAQELETVCPGLVFETPDCDADGNDLGTTTKGVNQSVLYMKAVKALQEAMERIETLEAKVAALESA